MGRINCKEPQTLSRGVWCFLTCKPGETKWLMIITIASTKLSCKRKAQGKVFFENAYNISLQSIINSSTGQLENHVTVSKQSMHHEACPGISRYHIDSISTSCHENFNTMIRQTYLCTNIQPLNIKSLIIQQTIYYHGSAKILSQNLTYPILSRIACTMNMALILQKDCTSQKKHRKFILHPTSL